MEHIQGEQWWTRYQPVSYLLESRSGTRSEFIDMVNRCRASGVNIYVDAVINHMSGSDRSGTGTGGSSFDGESQNYPDFQSNHFHQPFCIINSYTDTNMVRNCYLVGLNDLDGSQSYVQDVQAAYLNDLIDIGVAGFRVDAAKHMWPADIEALQAKLHDVLDGGRPYFFHEVIDLNQNGEISVNEYFGVGQTTEFRYCVKIKQCADGFWACPGVYDQGWGMSDPEHAFVFVDNHDNQRGHGGGGSILTHKDPVNYRYAVAFTMANDYGSKRIMSSYFFPDGATDQGPPSTDPGCGEDWVCEHRWKSIGQMAEFANVVYGEPVNYVVTEDRTLGMSRGNKGFFAMGDLNREFDTGLPDGDYCDIISECQQKITIAGGKGYFAVYDSNEPVVAICQGCTGQAVDVPTTTPNTAKTTTPITAKTTTKPDVTTTKPVTVTPNEDCCQEITLSSSGGVQEHYGEALGTYVLYSEGDRPTYIHKTNLVQTFLHHTQDSQHNWSGWQFTRDISDVFGFIGLEVDDQCPSGAKNEPWQYHLNGQWFEDETVTVTCNGEGPTTTSGPMPTTSGGSGGDTTKPNPVGFQRTIIFVEKETVPGQDVFIQGGQSDLSPIDIVIHPMPEIWESYNSWMEGDDKLDWEGPQPGQGTFMGYDAMGTAAAWTTDDETNEFYYEGNPGLGDNFWIIDMDMDCSQTQNGWFEFTTIYSIGGEDGEPSVAQESCTGDVGGDSPITGSKYHMARCGYTNIFSYGKDTCQIDPIP